MGTTDEQIMEAWLDDSNEQNYAAVGRKLGIERQTVRTRILKLRAEGHSLPPAKKAGYVLTSERAREIGRLRRVTQ